MITLAEFLLARFTDDLERAEFVSRQRPDGTGDLEPWRLSWHDEYDLLCIEPSRAIAEVEAKRKIVALHTCPCPDDCGECGACSGAHMSDPVPAPCDTLKLLALPYAGHPDHREEWRP